MFLKYSRWLANAFCIFSHCRLLLARLLATCWALEVCCALTTVWCDAFSFISAGRVACRWKVSIESSLGILLKSKASLTNASRNLLRTFIFRTFHGPDFVHAFNTKSRLTLWKLHLRGTSSCADSRRAFHCTRCRCFRVRRAFLTCQVIKY